MLTLEEWEVEPTSNLLPEPCIELMLWADSLLQYCSLTTYYYAPRCEAPNFQYVSQRNFFNTLTQRESLEMDRVFSNIQKLKQERNHMQAQSVEGHSGLNYTG